MPAWYQVHDEETGEITDWYGADGNYYLLEDGTKIDFSTTPAWCQLCQKIVGVEMILPPDFYEEQLQEVLDPNSQLNRSMADIKRKREEF